jgi:hypothetical protein
VRVASAQSTEKLRFIHLGQIEFAHALAALQVELDRAFRVSNAALKGDVLKVARCL